MQHPLGRNAQRGFLTERRVLVGVCLTSGQLDVGVTTDELVSYKGKHPIIPFEDRIEIIRSIKYVDAAIPQRDMDKVSMCKKLKAQLLFVGDDWYGTEKWQDYERDLEKDGIQVVYFPYTKGISSTTIENTLESAYKAGMGATEPINIQK